MKERRAEWDQTFHTQLSAGSGVGCREVNGSCHVHVHVVEDEHVPRSFFFHLNILQTNNRQNVNFGHINLTVEMVGEHRAESG